jgi:gamma-glutamyltranspeptidase/glutathione hydrolase
MKIDPHSHRYPSIRNCVFSSGGMACSSQPLVSSIGARVMADGGNAVDAAIAMAGAIALVEPTSNGLGGDAFALIWKDGKLYGLNSSGICPGRLTAEDVRSRGFDAVPARGWTSVLVPGAPAGWAEANRRFGTKSLKELWKPAAKLAREGFPVQPNVEDLWRGEYIGISEAAKRDGMDPYAEWFRTFSHGEGWYKAGEIYKNPDFADTIEELAETNCESFYRGRLAKAMCDFSDRTGGFFSMSDFESYSPMWVEPISVNYRGYDVFEIPPNGHGITALMALNILKGFELGNDRDDPAVWHKLIEAMKLAFVDARKYVADPRYMKTKVEDMLSDRYADERRALIGEKALYPEAGDPSGSDTVYFCAADGSGTMVSWIQSNYKHFGSGIVVPDTGIALQDRGFGFSLDPKSDNFLEGGKRSYHTIIPGFLCKDGKPVGPFGVMGGYMQPQGHMLVIVNTVDFGMNPQEALDCPRFQWTGGRKVQLEREVPAYVAADLSARGHELEILNCNNQMGRGQIIWKLENGVLCGGTESRADGSIAVV